MAPIVQAEPVETNVEPQQPQPQVVQPEEISIAQAEPVETETQPLPQVVQPAMAPVVQAEPIETKAELQQGQPQEVQPAMAPVAPSEPIETKAEPLQLQPQVVQPAAIPVAQAEPVRIELQQPQPQVVEPAAPTVQAEPVTMQAKPLQLQSQVVQPALVGQPIMIAPVAASRTMHVTIPAGYIGGQAMRVLTPDGQRIDIQLPHGVGPGNVVEVPYTAKLTPMVATSQKMNVTIPAGMVGGQAMTVSTPDGQQITVQLPREVAAGQVLEVPYTPRPMLKAGGQQWPPAPGCPPGGHWRREPYVGIVTLLIGLLLCICAFCCPCDQRWVYHSPDGRKVLSNGMVAEDCCDCNDPGPPRYSE
eukprot:TRINITY_DN34504_c0_g1_i1.p1 TRINITY_DN34504_c0_g1~~TRINITY_DN34504_c0_g1_i1.p1  ORF type:complete len:360 (-),score=44.13 TRINITY_DN34504_c0_g1_i1:16-1095(-)